MVVDEIEVFTQPGHKPEINKSAFVHSFKQTVFRWDSDRRAYKDVFTACLRGLCLYRCNLSLMRIQQTQQFI